MSYWSDMKDFARSEIEDIEDEEASLTVSKEDPINSDTLTLSLTWDDEFGDPFDDDKTRVRPTSRYVNVDEGSIRDISSDIFSRLVDSIDFKGTIESITLKENSMMMDDAPFVVTYGLSREEDVTDRGDAALDQIVNLGREHGLNFSKDDIVESEVVYSDFGTCEVSSVNAYIRTEDPSEYLSNVDSSEEIAEKIDDPSSFRSSDYCIVPFSVNREDLSDYQIETYESYMRSFVDDYVNTSFTYKLEGESIYSARGTVTDQDYCIAKPDFEYMEPDAEQEVYCWLHADVTEILGFNLNSDSN